MPPKFPPRPKNGPSQPLWRCHVCGRLLRADERVRLERTITRGDGTTTTVWEGRYVCPEDA